MTSINSNLTKKDREILRILQKDGRISNAALAREVNLSPSPCLERVKKLEKQGYILGYEAVLSAKKLELDALAYVEVTLNKTSREAFADFVASIETIDEISECNMVAGGFDFLLKVRVSDMAHYRKLLSEILVDLPHLGQTHTYMVIEQNKFRPQLPI